ncbi:hypothetical protein AHAS_Ahas17G0110300 [Arachis hypogaea]
MDEAAFGTEYLDGDGDLGNDVRGSGLARSEEVMEMLSNSPDEAARFYEQYSRGKGFAMRVEMRIKQNGQMGKWYVSRFVNDHNHVLLSPKLVEYLPPHRKMSDVDVAHMDSLRQVGISIPKIYESLAAQAGGFDHIPFTKRDMYNEVRRQRGMRNGDVNATIRYCMLAEIEIKEFEKHWEAMLDECGVQDVEWVQDLYTKKLYWATAYIHGRFFADIRTTSRCESLHAKLGRFVERRNAILDFVMNFQRCVEFLRDNEDEMDFRSSYGTLVLHTQFPEIEKSGAMKYTREIFSRFCESLQRCVRITVVESQPREGVSALVVVVDNGRVLDPIRVRTKGTGRGNVQVGVRGVKRRKCSTCGIVGHHRTRYPNRVNISVPNSQDEVPQMVSQSAARAEFPLARSLSIENIGGGTVSHFGPLVKYASEAHSSEDTEGVMDCRSMYAPSTIDNYEM